MYSYLYELNTHVDINYDTLQKTSSKVCNEYTKRYIKMNTILFQHSRGNIIFLWTELILKSLKFKLIIKNFRERLKMINFDL